MQCNTRQCKVMSFNAMKEIVTCLNQFNSQTFVFHVCIPCLYAYQCLCEHLCRQPLLNRKANYCRCLHILGKVCCVAIFRWSHSCLDLLPGYVWIFLTLKGSVPCNTFGPNLRRAYVWQARKKRILLRMKTLSVCSLACQCAWICGQDRESSHV